MKCFFYRSSPLLKAVKTAFFFGFALFLFLPFTASGDTPALKTIVIDPGHGGKDRGATGPSGLKEKDVVLDIAIKLKKELEKKGRFRVYLTRSRDEFVSLKQRKKIAKKYRPHAFISIHCDGNKDRKVRGTTVYILSKKGEKYTIQHSLTEGDYIFNGNNNSSNTLAEANHIMALTRQQNQRLADLTLKAIVRDLGTKNMRVRKAGFKVLKILDVPSILVEVAFISNWWEEKQLKKNEFRLRAAKAIAKAIEDFF